MNTEWIMVLAWIAVFVLMLIIEAVTLGLTTIWFAGGALVAFISSLLGAPLPLQIILFLVISFALLLGTRPVAMKYFNKDRVKTNADSLVGKIAVVIETIDNLHATGLVQVDGQEWSARSLDDSVVEKGKEVLVEKIDGVKLIVKVKENMED